MTSITNRTLFGLLIAGLAAHAHGGLISYELTPLGGSDYRYTYTVSNDGSIPGGADIELFDIAFEPSLYDESSLNIVTVDPPAGDWDELILASVLTDPAVYEAEAITSGLAVGESQTGFAVEFTWLGAGVPAAQAFEIWDPDSFDVIASGYTERTDANVPTPGSLVLMLPFVLFRVMKGRSLAR